MNEKYSRVRCVQRMYGWRQNKKDSNSEKEGGKYSFDDWTLSNFSPAVGKMNLELSMAQKLSPISFPPQFSCPKRPVSNIPARRVNVRKVYPFERRFQAGRLTLNIKQLTASESSTFLFPYKQEQTSLNDLRPTFSTLFISPSHSN